MLPMSHSSDPGFLGLRRRRGQTQKEEIARTSLLKVFHWGKRKAPQPLYVQVPLRDPQTEIRLLEVLPGTKEIIKCRLRSEPLTKTGNYEGLSYHWSGAVIENHVYVNDVHVPVHGNLYNALLYLRYADRTRVLWVDAICIDQERNEEHGEKSYQLALMPSIYGQAQRTVAYIGPEATGDGGTHILDGFVKQLLHSIEQLRRTKQWAGSLGTSAHYLSPSMRQGYNIPDDDHIGWQTLAHLVSRSWVERLWVVQEAAVAQEVIVQCGPYSFDFEEIAAAYALMWTLNVPEMNGISTSFKSVWAERVKQRSGQQRTLLSLVIRHWLSSCKYPHDKIYALRGLACDVGPAKHDSNFNYEKSADMVYTDFARDAIKLHRNLDILSCLAPFHEDRSAGLPSWVPDWRVFGDFTLVYRRPEPHPEPGPCTILFKASGDSHTDPEYSEDGRRVRLHGHVLDTIIDHGDIRPGKRTAPIAVAHFVDWRNKIARCSSEQYYEPTREPMIDVFYHTITMANLSNFLDDALAEYKVFDRNLLMLAHRLAIRDFDDDPNADVKQVQVAGVWEVVPFWLSIEKSVVTSASRPCVNRRMVRTERGYLGLVHGQTQVGDKIALFRGGIVPLVIRKQGDKWLIIGEGYVHGVMMGEKFEDNKCEPFWFS